MAYQVVGFFCLKKPHPASPRGGERKEKKIKRKNTK
jgi:hypothetical protein